MSERTLRTKPLTTRHGRPVRVLYSFPHKLGASRICHIAWQQVKGLVDAGAEVLVHPGVMHRAVPGVTEVFPTLARGRVRIPYKILGSDRALALHDYLVSKRLDRLKGIDIVHAWPLAARETLKKAASLGIPTVLERPNAYTGFAMDVVKRECERLGIVLPPGHEHAFDARRLRKEEEEYRLADRLLCPSDFVVKTFRDAGFEPGKLVRHQYGFDDSIYFPSFGETSARPGITLLFAGVCAVRKGLHFALEAWLASPASRDGRFLIAGTFLPAYQEKLAGMLAHPSVQVLGHRNDIPQLMRSSDALILPSIEEGYGLVIAEAIGSGCVPLASDACTEICQHMKTGMVHSVGDVGALTAQITLLHENPALLKRMRETSLSMAHRYTWTAAGTRLLDVYREVLASAGQPLPQVSERI